MPHFIFIQQISVLNIFNMLYNLHFFCSKCRLFHNATLFGFCITHILNTGCAKIWKEKIRRQKVKHNIIPTTLPRTSRDTMTILRLSRCLHKGLIIYLQHKLHIPQATGMKYYWCAFLFPFVLQHINNMKKRRRFIFIIVDTSPFIIHCCIW